MSNCLQHFFKIGINFCFTFKAFLLALHDDISCFDIKNNTNNKHYNKCRYYVNIQLESIDDGCYDSYYIL